MADPKAFERTCERIVDDLARRQQATGKEVRRILQRARRQVTAAGDLTASGLMRLREVEAGVAEALRQVNASLKKTATAGIDAAATLGQQLVDAPLQAAGIGVALPRADAVQLFGLRSATTDLISGITPSLEKKIRGTIGLVLSGAIDTAAGVDAVEASLVGGRNRALTIMRTGMGRAFSTATHDRQRAAVAAGVTGMKKQWRRPGRLHSRLTHDAADGQVVDVDKPFIVNGERLMFPRDPNGSPGETINCGCVSLPFMEHWKVEYPGEKPFSPAEKLDAGRQNLERKTNRRRAPTGPGPARIAALEERPAEEARQIVTDLVASRKFRKFVKDAGRERVEDALPVGVLPADLKALPGTAAGIVRFSSHTAAKQDKHRRGQDFTAGDYRRVQRMLDEGEWAASAKNHIASRGIFEDGQWKAVLKRTRKGHEVYLQTLHRVGRQK